MSEDPTISTRESMLRNPGNPCFVCGPANPIGLKLQFSLVQMEGELVCVGEFTPQPEHMGYDNVTHGGIVFSLLDDVMANWVWLQGEQCFTGRADIRYRDQLAIGTPVRLEGRCVKRRRRMAQMEGRVLRQDNGEVVAEASGVFMIPEDATS